MEADVFRVDPISGPPLYFAIDENGECWRSDHKGPWVSCAYRAPAALERDGYRFVHRTRAFANSTPTAFPAEDK